MLDQLSIIFLTPDQCNHLIRFRLLQDYLADKQKDIDAWNQQLQEQGKEPVNTRRITNIGTFRTYVDRYLRSHGGIHQEMTLMVRQLSPDRKSTRLNSSHVAISYAVFCLKKKKKNTQ